MTEIQVAQRKDRRGVEDTGNDICIYQRGRGKEKKRQNEGQSATENEKSKSKTRKEANRSDGIGKNNEKKILVQQMFTDQPDLYQ